MTDTLGNKIHQARKKAGLTLEQVAKKIGSSKGYMWEIEAGYCEPSFSKVCSIAKALCVDIKELEPKQ